MIFLLAPSGWDEVVDCPVYSLDSYDAESLELLEQRELSRSWYIRPEQLPEHGFRDMAYDPVSGYLTAVSDQLMVSIDLNQGRFYMAGDASRQLGGAELLGIAFDSDGNGWYADSAGAVGKVMSYLGAVELEPSGLVLPIGQDPGKRSGMEYDELVRSAVDCRRRTLVWHPGIGRLPAVSVCFRAGRVVLPAYSTLPQRTKLNK